MYCSVVCVQDWEPPFRVPWAYCQLWSRGGKPAVLTTRKYTRDYTRNIAFSTSTIASRIAITPVFVLLLIKEYAKALRRGIRWRIDESFGSGTDLS